MTEIPTVDASEAANYTARGWWGTRTVADYVRENAQTSPERVAFVNGPTRTTWAQYDGAVDALAGVLAALLARDARFGVFLPDSAEFHIALCAGERSGCVAVGIGARSGRAELEYLMRRSGSRVLVMRAAHRGRSAEEYAADLAADGHELDAVIVVDTTGPVRLLRVADGVAVDDGLPAPAAAAIVQSRAFGANELSMLNSTSGTTGRPKLVTQFANRWVRFSDIAFEAGGFEPTDVILGAVPGPFGFGLWTAHYAPAMRCLTTVLMEHFDADEMVRLIVRENVTVLACVSTQFKMMLDSAELPSVEGGSLRAMFTGGEAVPYERAREFEERTGAAVLQFYGSNEGGSVTCTTLADTVERRLRTAGRVCDDTDVRLYDPQGNDITATGGPGRPGVAGPTICIGYFDDAAANDELFHDGHLMMPDLVTIDADGYLTVVGRTSDLIIRGGKNISAVEVEELVESHPGVAMAAAVPVPDHVFGERIGVAVELRAGQSPLSVADLAEYLTARGVSKHLFPERVLTVEALPRAAGGKVAKGQVKSLFEAEDAEASLQGAGR